MGQGRLNVCGNLRRLERHLPIQRSDHYHPPMVVCGVKEAESPMVSFEDMDKYLGYRPCFGSLQR
jgi:hypothetical protein